MGVMGVRHRAGDVWTEVRAGVRLWACHHRHQRRRKGKDKEMLQAPAPAPALVQVLAARAACWVCLGLQPKPCSRPRVAGR